MGKSEGKSDLGSGSRIDSAGPGPSTDATVVGQVWSMLRVPIAEARKLVEFVDGTSRPRGWPGRKINGSLDPPFTPDEIIAMEFSRSTTSCRAVLDLIALGYNDQAHMICRSMFEGLLVAIWVDQNEALAVERFQEISRLADFQDANLGKELGWGSDDYAAEFDIDGEELKRLRREYGYGGQKLWTKPNNPHELVKSFTGLGEQEVAALEMFTKIAYQSQNRAMHATLASLLSSILNLSEQGITLKMGPKADVDMEAAIHAAWWTYSAMADLIMNRFGFPMLKEFQEFKDRSEPIFSVVYEDQAESVDRNDLCPCESGRKFKVCHGDRLRKRRALEGPS